MAWRNNFWNSLKGPDGIVLRRVFESLSNFLDDPDFTNGISVGDGTPPTVSPDGVIIRPPTVRVQPEVLVPDDESAPATPTGLAVTAGIGSLFFAWDESTEIDMVDGYGTYQLQISTDVGFGTTVEDVAIGTNGAAVTGLTSATTYYGRVRARDAHGNTSAWSTAVSDAPTLISIPDLDTDVYTIPNDEATPAVPVGLTVTAGFKALFVKWTANTEIDMENFLGTYQVQLATDTGFTSVVADVSVGATTAAFTDLSTDNQYFIRIKAIDAHGNESAWASYASGTPVTVASVDIEPGAITGDKISDFAVAAKKFNTDTHILY